MNKRNELILLLIIFLVGFLLRMVFLHVPIEFDEGIYSYIGQVILDGGLPYRDAIDLKPPGIYYIYAAMIWIGGASSEAIRVLTAIYTLGTIFFVQQITRMLAGRVAGLSAALVLAVVGSGPLLQANGSNTEIFLLLPLSAGVWLIMLGRQRRRFIYFAGSGICAAIAILIKTVVFPIVMVLFVFTILSLEKEESWRDTSKRALAFIAPMLVIWSGVALYFAACGIFADFWYWNVVFIKKYCEAPGFAGHLLGLRMHLPNLVEQLPIWLMARFAISPLSQSSMRSSGSPIVFLLLASLVSVALPGRYFPHYFILLLLPLSILAGIGFNYLLTFRTITNRIGMLLVATAWLGLAVIEFPWYVSYSPAEVVQRQYPYADFYHFALLAEDIRKKTTPRDTIFQWGWEPEVYFISNRRSATRFIAVVFVGGAPDSDEATKQLINDLRTKKPRCIIVSKIMDKNTLGTKEVMSEVNSYYILERSEKIADIYYRK